MSDPVALVMLPTSGSKTTPFYGGWTHGGKLPVDVELYRTLPGLLEKLVEAANKNVPFVLSANVNVPPLPTNKLRLELWVSAQPAFRDRRSYVDVLPNDTVQTVTGRIKTWYNEHMADVKDGAYADWINRGRGSEFRPIVHDKGDIGYEITFLYATPTNWIKLTGFSAASVTVFAAACIIAAAAFVYWAPDQAAAWVATPSL
jgi:hypothetical protein